MKTLVFPGSFDPITNGHLDMIKRASKLCTTLKVVIVKTNNRLPLKTRLNLAKEAIADIGLSNVEVDINEDLMVEYMQKNNYQFLLRGIRNNNDYQFEQSLEINNKNLFPKLETIYMLTSPEHLHVSSSAVWEISRYGGDISNLVPKNVQSYLKENCENI